MTPPLPQIQVGEPILHESLAVFPLFAETGSQADYALSDAALEAGTVTVEEVSEEGSVPELAVHNEGSLRVLFIEGEELVGAKQNRILNTSVLVAAGTQARIPVSCVEADRWRYTSRRFGSAGRHASARLRRVLKKSVTSAARNRREHRSDQLGVWEEVARQQAALGAASPTSAMADTFEAYADRLETFREKTKYVDGAIGLAAAIGDQIVSIDLFDKPETCRRVWNRILSGLMLEALEAKSESVTAKSDDVRARIDQLRALPWEQVQAAGEGEEYRAASPRGDHATALVLQDTLVHGSAVYEVGSV